MIEKFKNENQKEDLIVYRFPQDDDFWDIKVIDNFMQYNAPQIANAQNVAVIGSVEVFRVW